MQALVADEAKVTLVDAADDVVLEHSFEEGPPIVMVDLPVDTNFDELRALVTLPDEAEPTEFNVDRVVQPGSAVPRIVISRQTASDPEVTELLEHDPEKLGGEPTELSLPVNPFRPRQVFRYFQISPGLRASEWGSGEAKDYEMSWRSLGWALDDWVSTRSLDPMQTMATAHASISQDSTITQSGGTSNREGVGSERQSFDGSDQRLDATTEMSGSTRSMGVGANLSVNVAPLAAGPAGALGKTIGGAVQAGVGVASSEGKTTSSATIGKRIVSAVQDAAQRQRVVESESGRQAHHGLADDRILTASSNPNPSTENVCRYSIVHQWRVKTRRVRVVPIKLVPIQGLTEKFDLETVVANRAILLEHLLDERYAALLSTVEIADGQRAPDPPSPHPIKSISFDIEFSDPPRAKDGTFKLQIHHSGGPPLEASLKGKVERGEHWTGHLLPPNGATLTVSTLQKLEFVFSNPGLITVDTAVTIARGLITWRATGEDADRTLAHLGQTRVPHDEHRWITITPVVPGMVEPGLPRDVSALLAHLNANLAHYRTEIDLARHPVERFVSLGDKAEELADMEPIGVVGAHLAFEAPATGTSPGDSEEPVVDVVSIATGATWEEAISGKSKIRERALTARWTNLPAADTKAVAWPPVGGLTMPGELASPQDDTTLTAPAHEAADAGDPPTMAEVTAMADKLNAALKDLTAAAQAAAAAPAAGTGAAAPPADGEGDDDGDDGDDGK
ncbi:MAG TPA: hypothetical protein VNQ33_01675 [Acidimicrobiales bacterium]|nr:hypothetical protein [Acidimicrobiales bacterium]